MQTPPEPSDERLLALVAQGQGDALELLYRRWAPRMAWVARRAGVGDDEVADLIQSIFLEIWTRAGRYRPERGPAAGWLFQLARSRTIDCLRRRPRWDPLPDPPPPPPSEGREERWALDQALGSLSPRERAVLELAYFGGFTQREIAEAWGVPLGTVKTWGHRGLEKLRRMLLGDVQPGQEGEEKGP
ncbi:MAG: sigma-70 family RNA polymerase sigma factor [Firmicutes bacterium]|nr:sigma-70 family RNA polymerase sigma factor [Alicyclobacillaceae bacterium]MCL6496093.1 sigma-70 family RNA polymerase sigma factor [Bacillota bacterium]